MMGNEYRPHLLPKIRSKAIMQAASGSPCTLRIASFYPGGKCSGRTNVVGCHLPVWGKGQSTKVTDLAVAFGCDVCHAILDGVDMKKHNYLMAHYEAAVMQRLLFGLTETHAILAIKGIIEIPDNDGDPIEAEAFYGL